MNVGWRYEGSKGVDPSRTGFGQSRYFADVGHVLDHVASAYPEFNPGSGSVKSIWLAPAQRFDVAYEVNLGSGEKRVVLVRYLRDGEAFDADGCRVRSLPGLNAISWEPENDPAFSSLCALDARDSVGFLACCKQEVLSYSPGRRCVIKLSSNHETFVLKMGDGAHRNHPKLDSLWRRSDRTFLMPDPVAPIAAVQGRLERFLSGTRLGEIACQSLFSEAMDGALGAAVEMHAMPALADLPLLGPSDVLKRSERKVLPAIERALPELAERVRRVLSLLRDRSREAECPRVSMIHGDLHAANILAVDGKVAFIDLDDLVLGDPAYDLALLGTRLILAQLCVPNGLQEMGRLTATLHERYAAFGGVRISDERFAWYVAALLIGRQIKSLVRHAPPNAPELCEMLVSMAERTARQGRYYGTI